MNTFHELNIMTSRGDIHGAFSLIRSWSENVARKIMKKAGYSVAVANAPSEVKAAANEVTNCDCTGGAVGEFLYKLISKVEGV